MFFLVSEESEKTLRLAKRQVQSRIIRISKYVNKSQRTANHRNRSTNHFMLFFFLSLYSSSFSQACLTKDAFHIVKVVEKIDREARNDSLILEYYTVAVVISIRCEHTYKMDNEIFFFSVCSSQYLIRKIEIGVASKIFDLNLIDSNRMPLFYFCFISDLNKVFMLLIVEKQTGKKTDSVNIHTFN